MSKTDDNGYTCEDCRWCLLEEYGWSNWTVEGTQVYCLKGEHPSGREGFDRWYGGDERLHFALQCPTFTPGPPTTVDVEKEKAPFEESSHWWDYYTNDEDVRALIAQLHTPSL